MRQFILPLLRSICATRAISDWRWPRALPYTAPSVAMVSFGFPMTPPRLGARQRR